MRSNIVLSLAAAALLGAGPVLAQEGKSQPRPEDAPPTDGARAAGEGAALFERLDANKDGSLAADEVPDENRRLFNRLLRRSDRNDDGKLSREEFVAGLAEDGPPRGPDARRPGGAPDGPRPDGAPEGRRPDGPREDRRPDGPQRPRGEGDARPNMPPGGGPGSMLGPVLMMTLDKDRNGSLSAAEISAAADALKKLDANGDGEITREELVRASRELAPPGAGPGGPQGEMTREEAFKRLMDQFDRNSDNKLQADELPPRIQDRFDQIDANKDGLLQADEIPPGLMRRPPGERGPAADRPGRRPGQPEGEGEKGDRKKGDRKRAENN